MTFFKMLAKVFGPSRKDRIDMAIRRHAKAIGDVEQARIEVVEYTAILKGFDPRVDWWGYAQARQDLEDAQDDVRRCCAHALTVEQALREVQREEADTQTVS